MKLLFIRSTSGVSGAEMYTLQLAHALEEKHVEVHILTNYEPFYQRLIQERLHASNVFLPIKEAGTKREFLVLLLCLIYFIPLFLWKIKQIEKEVKFHTIVLESANEKLFLSPFLKLFGYRVVWIEHGPLFRTDRSEIIKRLYTFINRWADIIITVSRDTEEDILLGGVSKNKIRTIYFGVDYVSEKPERGIQEGKKVTIGFLGSLTKEKGIAEFLDAAHAIIQKHAYASFCVIGGGPLLGWAKQYVRTLNMQKNVLFTGRVDDATTYLRHMDIMYFPTKHLEGLSLAILESLALGKIVVARDIGGNRELVIDKKTGFLYQTDGEGEQLLDDIITGNISIKNISTSARTHIRNNFLMEKQVRTFIEVFHG